MDLDDPLFEMKWMIQFLNGFEWCIISKDMDDPILKWIWMIHYLNEKQAGKY
jgi:hypothetical protein